MRAWGLRTIELDEEKIASELKGNTLRVYWALLQAPKGIVGVREIQRSLGFSSPNLAAYHLRKLEDLGLVKEKRGEYYLEREIRVGVLKQFMKVGSVMLPRYTLYAALFTTLLGYYLLQINDITFDSIFAVIFGGIATLIMWYETMRLWRQKP